MIHRDDEVNIVKLEVLRAATIRSNVKWLHDSQFWTRLCRRRGWCYEVMMAEREEMD